jgi:hypothetical protein
MDKQTFMNLKPGDYSVYDPEPNTYGIVKEGPWRNCFRDELNGNGVYICWDDGDNACVGLEYHNNDQIERFELMDFIPT